MAKKILTLKLAGLALGGGILFFSGGASAQASVYSLQDGKSTVSFSGKSTLHGFEGQAHQVKGRIEYVPETGAVKMPVQIEIPAALLESNSSGRDQGMFKMFDAEHFKTITWTADQMSCTPLSGLGLAACKADGRLRIRNVEQKVSFLIQLRGQEDSLEAESSFPISLQAFQLKPPSVFGVIRVFDTVTVKLKTLWNKEPL